ncbi:MAG TPA: hypothetical protein VII69_14645 [Candidatus Eremiobacteraceae bacterium]
MIDASSSLEDVVFAVCTGLDARGLKVVLVGGSAATFYSAAAYQSFDADFIAQFAAGRKTEALLVATMSGLGYDLDLQRTFRHRNGSPFAIEFPKGPLGIGGDYVGYKTVRRDGETLYVISPTDSVRDRLCGYYYWDDRSALIAAVDVSLAASDDVDLDGIQVWSSREGHLAKHADFRRLRDSRASAARA